MITVKGIDKMDLEFKITEKRSDGYREIEYVPFYKQNGYWCVDMEKVC